MIAFLLFCSFLCSQMFVVTTACHACFCLQIARPYSEKNGRQKHNGNATVKEEKKEKKSKTCAVIWKCVKSFFPPPYLISAIQIWHWWNGKLHSTQRTKHSSWHGQKTLRVFGQHVLDPLFALTRKWTREAVPSESSVWGGGGNE